MVADLVYSGNLPSEKRSQGFHKVHPRSGYPRSWCQEGAQIVAEAKGSRGVAATGGSDTEEWAERRGQAGSARGLRESSSGAIPGRQKGKVQEGSRPVSRQHPGCEERCTYQHPCTVTPAAHEQDSPCPRRRGKVLHPHWSWSLNKLICKPALQTISRAASSTGKYVMVMGVVRSCSPEPVLRAVKMTDLSENPVHKNMWSLEVEDLHRVIP
ncbi:recQ-mediated genome instability protein 2 [Athene cunicularia]|uniref:recQ-mediated genome instability protein 2 n=1 Tax=Athene cunicularia TaxID=194338 RepID=UPI000EF66EB0|nr:recQ-mediated genome instability protein 2 [Athene cunicularia]